ncbi:MAG TPA: methyltransferase, partial [Polyangiaceae bacterium]|nr:methyltransferase [Polyangiaceae bacterium]
PILELFAGSGNFSIALARQTPDLETVEQQDAAVAAARSNLETRGLRARLRVDDAEKTIVRSAVRTVVLDPPRTGAKRAVQTIAASRARDVVMVSCDPATLARDSAILVHQGRFELHRIDVFEMFPHTSHVETVACFRRKR